MDSCYRSSCLLLSRRLLARRLGTLLSVLTTAKNGKTRKNIAYIGSSEIRKFGNTYNVAEVRKYGSTYFGSTRGHFTSARFVGKRIGTASEPSSVESTASMLSSPKVWLVTVLRDS